MADDEVVVVVLMLGGDVVGPQSAIRSKGQSVDIDAALTVPASETKRAWQAIGGADRWW